MTLGSDPPVRMPCLRAILWTAELWQFDARGAAEYTSDIRLRLEACGKALREALESCGQAEPALVECRPDPGKTAELSESVKATLRLSRSQPIPPQGAPEWTTSLEPAPKENTWPKWQEPAKSRVWPQSLRDGWSLHDSRPWWWRPGGISHGKSTRTVANHAGQAREAEESDSPRCYSVASPFPSRKKC